MTSAEWKNAPDFEEFAEALKVKTTQVVTALVQGRTAAVIYSPDDTDHERVVLIGLRRDNDGIYQQTNVPQELPGFFDGLRERIDKAMKDELGEPGEEKE